MRRRWLPLFTLAFLLSGCGGDDDDGGSDPVDASTLGIDAPSTPDADPGPKTVFGGDRPATLNVPPDYDPAEPAPLLVVLAGYANDPAYAVGYLRFEMVHMTDGVFWIQPAGLEDPDGNHFWNATDACCDLFDDGVDDVAYLSGLIEEIQAEYNIDPKRIWIAGHSNGSFMALRMACDRADLVAAVISHAGAAFLDSASCSPSEPVSVLHIHGDADGTIAFAGGTSEQNDGEMIPYPGAAATVAQWAAHNGCADTTTEGTAIDLDALVAGDETTVTTHDACPTGIDAELWASAGAGHLYVFTEIVPAGLLDWLRDHPKP